MSLSNTVFNVSAGFLSLHLFAHSPGLPISLDIYHGLKSIPKRHKVDLNLLSLVFQGIAGLFT